MKLDRLIDLLELVSILVKVFFRTKIIQKKLKNKNKSIKFRERRKLFQQLFHLQRKIVAIAVFTIQNFQDTNGTDEKIQKDIFEIKSFFFELMNQNKWNL